MAIASGGVILLCSALFWWGGFSWKPARRYIMSFVLALYIGILTKTWWMVPAIWIPMAGALSIGYGDDSIFRKVFSNTWGRGVWGLIVAIGASLALVFGGFLHWYWFLLYCAIGFALEAFLKDIPQPVGDPLIGAGFASLIFFIK